MSTWPRFVHIALVVLAFCIVLVLGYFTTLLQVNDKSIQLLPTIYWGYLSAAMLLFIVGIMSACYLAPSNSRAGSFAGTFIVVGSIILLQGLFEVLTSGWNGDSVEAVGAGASMILGGVFALLAMRRINRRVEE